ncbi:MAG: UbiX family flavin prenyltransferase [Pyrodictiaceae archaeon]
MKILVAITGASGIRYGVRLVEVLVLKAMKPDVIVTRAAEAVARVEEGYLLRERLSRLGVRIYSEDDFTSPYASSSNVPDAMVIAPCSIKTVSMISAGISANLVVRAALNVLRMRRRLVLVVRETPLGVVELKKLLEAAEAGAIVLPASPGFYHKPSSIDDLVDFIVGKILDVIGIEHNLYQRWNGREE